MDITDQKKFNMDSMTKHSVMIKKKKNRKSIKLNMSFKIAKRIVCFQFKENDTLEQANGKDSGSRLQKILASESVEEEISRRQIENVLKNKRYSKCLMYIKKHIEIKSICGKWETKEKSEK